MKKTPHLFLIALLAGSFTAAQAQTTATIAPGDAVVIDASKQKPGVSVETEMINGQPASIIVVNKDQPPPPPPPAEPREVTLLDVSFLFWSIPGSHNEVAGLRLNLGFAENRGMYGLDLGLGSLTSGDSGAIQINPLFNVVDGDAGGLQIGLFNRGGKSMSGIQIGLINSTDDLHGIQIGLINVNDSLTLPIINIGF